MGKGWIGRRPIATYSIVARDGTGALGVGVQSHWFNVGAVVPWVEAGVGAVAVQSISDPSSGTRALDQLRSGGSAAAALESLLDRDEQAAYRQIAIVDADGVVATHTGDLCIAEAGHDIGAGFSAQANLMDRPSVWSAMTEAFAGADGDLAERLVTALEAADNEGGDVRGRQSAALVVVPAPGRDDPAFDLRVEDAPDPLGELRRLVSLQRAYIQLNRGDAMMAAGRADAALADYEAATQMVPDSATDGEAAFWTGVAFAGNGRVDDGVPYLARAAVFGEQWKKLLPRLVRSEMFPDDDALLQRALDAVSPDEQ
ncbi:MAG TPA: DUF1028 domain-containing protein [Actinomycetota bacterium]|nr:DUF1028 domain-containing protein [Actinomycetota bacterium]